MALAVTSWLSVGDTNTAGGTTFSPAAFTPSANSILVACIVTTLGGSTNPPLPTVTNTGMSLTWVQIADFIYVPTGTNRNRMAIFAAAVGASPSSVSVTMTCSAGPSGIGYHFFDITGTDVANVGVASCFVQSVTTTANSTGTSLAITLATGGNANNRPFLFAAQGNQATTFETGNNWAQIGSNGNYTSPATGSAVGWKTDGFDTSVTASWTTSTAYGGIAFELKASSAVVYTLTVTPASAPPLSLSSIGLRANRTLAVTPASAPPLAFNTVGLRKNSRLLVTFALNFAYATNSVTLLKAVKLSVTPANIAYTSQNINLRANHRLVMTPATAPLLTLRPIGMSKATVLTVTGPLNFGFTTQNVNLRRTYTLPVSPASTLYLVRNVFFRKGSRLTIDTAVFDFSTFPDIGLRKNSRLTVGLINFSFGTSNVTMARARGTNFETFNIPFALNAVGLKYIFTPVHVPGPELKPAPTRLKPGDRVYVSVQGDMWDLISHKVYGMQRGSDHQLHRLIAANPELQEYNRFPGCLYVLVPPLPTQAEIPLVPWKRATILIKP